MYAVAAAEVDGTPVAVTGGDDGVRTWDLRTGRPRRTARHEDGYCTQHHKMHEARLEQDAAQLLAG